jgi:ligand-binding sensor domain-containing protein
MERAGRIRLAVGGIVLLIAAASASAAVEIAPIVPITPIAPAGRVDIQQISQVPAQSFDEGSGLPDLTVTAVSTAPDGYVWVGTMRGLARFEGHRMTPVAGPHGALSAPIADVATLADGTVWVALKQGGVLRWDGKRWDDSAVNAGLGAARISRLRAFPGRGGGTLFASGVGSLSEWRGSRWVARVLPTALANSEIFDVERVETNGREVLWLATFGQGLWRCLDGRCAAMPIDGDGPRFNEISTLALVNETDGSTTLWAGSFGGGVASLANGRWTRFHTGNSALTSNYTHRFEVVPGNGAAPQVWAGLRSGLARWRDGRWEMAQLLGRESGGRVKTIARGEDAQGNPQLWLGTDVGAVRLRLDGSWRTVSRVGQQGNGVWATLLEQHRVDAERLWLGSDGDGLMRFEDGQWTRFGLADGLPNMTVRSLARVNEGRGAGVLWVGTWNGELARFDGTRFQVMPTPWPKSDREAVTKILPVGPGEAWIALRNGGVAQYLDGTWTYHDPRQAGNPSRIADLLMTGAGADRRLWASTRTVGLAVLTDGRWRQFGVREGFASNELFGMILLPDNRGRPVLWLGTNDRGIVRIDIGDPDQPTLVTSPSLPSRCTP